MRIKLTGAFEFMLRNTYLYIGLLHHPTTIVCLSCLSHRLQIEDYNFIVPDKFVLCAELVRYNYW